MTTSGYEKSLLTELLIAKVISWIMFLLFGAVITTLLMGYRPVQHEGWVAIVVLVAGVMSAECETLAEAKLKTIHVEESNRKEVG